MSDYAFTSALWLHSEMPGSWYFVTLPAAGVDDGDLVAVTLTLR